MNKSALSLALSACMGSAAADLSAATIGSMSVTSGSFGAGVYTGFGYIPFTGTGSDNDIAAYSSFAGNNTAHPVGSGGTCAAGSVACFDFSATQVNIFTAAASPQSGVSGGGPQLSGQSYDESGGATTVDMSAWFANLSGTDWPQGNSAVTLNTGNCVAGVCDFTASWSSPTVGGTFDGRTGCWQIAGTVSAIPVPASVWLMGSGAGGLLALSRRRKKPR